MNVQPYQLIYLSIYLCLIWGILKVKSNKIKILILILGLILFFVNPIRFKQEGGFKIERNITRFNKLPKKENVEIRGFQERQDEEMNKLKKQSENLKDEIHD